MIESTCKNCVQMTCVNSSTNVILSNDRKAILKLFKIFQRKDIFVRELTIEVVYHFQHMKDMTNEYRVVLANLSVINHNRIEFYFFVMKKRVSIFVLDINYWISNMINSVQFLNFTQCFLSDEDTKIVINVLIEIKSHSTLQNSIKQILQQVSNLKVVNVLYQPSLVRNVNVIQTCHDFVTLFIELDYSINFHHVNFAFDSNNNKLLCDLSSYSWNHSKSY